MVHHNTHRKGKNVLCETWRLQKAFQQRLRVLSDASGVEAISYAAAGGPDGLEHWSEEVLSSGVGRKMQQGIPAHAAACSAMIYVESISKRCSKTGVAGSSVSRACIGIVWPTGWTPTYASYKRHAIHRHVAP